MKTYVVKKVNSNPTEEDWENANVAELSCAPWKDAVFPYTMQARLLHSDDKLFVNLITNEKHLRAVHNNRNDQVCEDSCMEFFIAPDENDERYMNFEINPLGTLLLYVCNERITMVPDTTDESIFDIKSFITKDSWQLTYQIPYSIFLKHFKNISNEMKGNFYKCGEKTDVSHFGCWNPVDVEYDFHIKRCFGKIVLE